MNYKSLLFSFFFLVHSFCIAQNVKIIGLAKTYENKEIDVWAYKDFISNTEKQLTYSTIDSVGNFLLEFNNKEIQYITLKIEKSVASFYVEPNASYEIIVFPPDSTTYQNPNLEHDVKISINLRSKTEINALMMDYDKRFDNFLTKEYAAFVSRNPQPKIDSFKVAMNNFYTDVKNDYFKAYRLYTIAALEEKTKMSKKKLFSKYLDHQPILYNNQEYFNFFNTFYKQMLRNFLQTQGKELITQVETNNSVSGAMNILKSNVFLHNDTIRELVLIKGLYESYYDGAFKRPAIVKMLENIIDESKIEVHIQIAQNMLNSFSKLKPGAAAPYFELPDKTGLTHSLDELRSKKYVYLFLFDQQCTSCLQQMKIIASLKKQYGIRIEFVAISLDKSNANFKNFCLENSQYDWLFLFDNTGNKFKNDYEIKSLPACFLIDTNGKFVQAPAERPDGDIDRAFFDITKPKGKKHVVGDKTNR